MAGVRCQEAMRFADLAWFTYSSGGEVFYARIMKTANKWVRWAFIGAVQPAIDNDPDSFMYYQRLGIRKGAIV